MGASPFTVGILMSLVAALPMLLAVRAGRLVDRIGVRYPMIGAVALLGLSVVEPAAFPGFASLFVAAAGAGVGFMLFHISIQHTVGEGSSEAERRDNFGWLSLGFSISNFLGPFVAGFAIDLFGQRSTFVLLSIFAFAAFVLLAVGRGHFRHTPHATRAEAEGGTMELLKNAELRRVFVVTGMLASAWDLFMF